MCHGAGLKHDIVVAEQASPEGLSLGIREWPSWWDWELELSPHLLKRMIDREFTEVDLRRMLEQATGLREDVVDGRWLVETWHVGRPWGVIVEPDIVPQLLVVITAYPIW